MNRNLLVFVLSLLVLFASEAQNAQPTSINIIAWLAGSWRGEAYGGEVEEIWSQPVGGTMMGMFRIIEKGKIIAHNFKHNALLKEPSNGWWNPVLKFMRD
jgi:uncharacterized protein DUF6265